MTTREQAWAALASHHDEVEDVHMRALWQDDKDRFASFSLSVDDILFDYSKHRITHETINLLTGLAEACGVESRRNAMFAGEAINNSEGRAVLHTALRDNAKAPLTVDGVNVRPIIANERNRALAFADKIRGGEMTGYTGEAFTDVVNIGIGGSDLGPAMTVAALSPYADGPNVHFVSNVDGAHLSDTLDGLNPATTFFIVASKTFTTAETLQNAANARAWLVQSTNKHAVRTQFAALSTNIAAAEDFGICEDHVFGFWDWVGGRYSIWSSIGLALMIAIGPRRYDAFISGAHKADQHFLTAPLSQNVPVIMGLLGIWYRNFFNCASHAILPYDQRLHRFPAYLQQLDMESNGKSVTKDGEAVPCKTGPLIWGEPGTNGQHAFYQLLHQGTDIIPADILIAANPHEADRTSHDMLLANAFAQSEALMIGRSESEALALLAGKDMDENEAARLARHKTFPGNRPTTTLLYNKLDPATLGSLIAVYEHKVFVQGVIWNINPFDQMGVELGKELAVFLMPAIEGLGTSKSSSTPIIHEARLRREC